MYHGPQKMGFVVFHLIYRFLFLQFSISLAIFCLILMSDVRIYPNSPKPFTSDVTFLVNGPLPYEARSTGPLERSIGVIGNNWITAK